MKKTLIWLAIGLTVLAIRTWDRNRPIDGPGLRMEPEVAAPAAVPISDQFELVVKRVDGSVLFEGPQDEVYILSKKWKNQRITVVTFDMDMTTGGGKAVVTIDPDVTAPDINLDMAKFLADPEFLKTVKFELRDSSGKTLMAGNMDELSKYMDSLPEVPELSMMSGSMFFDAENKLDHGLYRYTVK